MKKLIMIMVACVPLILGVVSCDRDDDTADDQNTQNAGEWVDLGLPSGLLWYSMNLGATIPEGYGDYYAWGELQTKEVYGWSTYTYGNYDSTLHLYKYNTSETYGTVDIKTVLESSDDVATAVLGNGARIPTKDEWNELLNNTTAEWMTQNGVAGRKFTATNGNSIFLPAADGCFDSELDGVGLRGLYWSSSLYTDFPYYAWFCFFGSDYQYVNCNERCYVFSVRAVRASQN